MDNEESKIPILGKACVVKIFTVAVFYLSDGNR